MIDLSNNNRGTEDFATVYKHGTRRVYLKLTEGPYFHDLTFSARAKAAHKAGLKVGAYHFARPSSHTPQEEAAFFLSKLPKLYAGRDMRPALDLEDPLQIPTPATGKWAAEFVSIVRRTSGHQVVIYGYGSYLAACEFPKAIGPLWLAAYGRNDGVEHPYVVPKPWQAAAAHQYASTARVAGIVGEVDVSNVLNPRALDVRVTR